MINVIMCTSKYCPVRDTCYRARVKEEESCSWNNFEYTCNENNGYIDFIPITAQNNTNKIIR